MAEHFEQTRQDILSFLDIDTNDLTINIFARKNLLRGIINNFFDGLTISNIDRLNNLQNLNNFLVIRKKRNYNALLRRRVLFSSKLRNKKVPHRLGTL